jgi:hypothetical protein
MGFVVFAPKRPRHQPEHHRIRKRLGEKRAMTVGLLIGHERDRASLVMRQDWCGRNPIGEGQ